MTATTRKRGGLGPVLVIGMAVLAVWGVVISNNTEHATKKHAHAPTLRRVHEDGLCRRQEAYVSPQRGTLLVLCQMDVNVWGGIVWRVLEIRHGEQVLMRKADMYEATAFASDRAYWEGVIARDGYVKAHDTRWYKPLRWIIHP